MTTSEPTTPEDDSDQPDGEDAEEGGSRLASVVSASFGDPVTVLLFGLLLVLAIAVVVRFQLPAEYWMVFTGLATGVAQAAAEQRKAD